MGPAVPGRRCGRDRDGTPGDGHRSLGYRASDRDYGDPSPGPGAGALPGNLKAGPGISGSGVVTQHHDDRDSGSESELSCARAGPAAANSDSDSDSDRETEFILRLAGPGPGLRPGHRHWHPSPLAGRDGHWAARACQPGGCQAESPSPGHVTAGPGPK